ncbi:glycosyltransferase family 39 protein [Alicyclobacillus dauci]|uniref:Glycosyltransferase family 39 protein n=1 Tax=Alicyclobacillus dauci TaxID=1475485 RepID=A0ABY6Z332_9BACL|nr:glycosyltransferase family 39 protein [Alicyclobacillus dauci]WAH36741.1 glycosyltransferase family 39 protein [Alicyclobacillus dauci]
MSKARSLPILVVLIAFIIRIFVIFHYGPYVSIHSDDMGYYRSAEWLLQYGKYAFYTPDAPTVHMLPGMTFILAAVIAVFGKGALGLYVGKVVFTIIGCLGIFGAYKAVEHMWNRPVALIVALFLAVYVPGIETDTLFLTEPPFMAAFAWLVYFVLRAGKEHKTSDIVWASIMFVAAIYFRPNIILWAVVALAYLMSMRYPWKLLVSHMGLVVGIVVICLAPWWIRNEIAFHQFIPLTDDSSNPLLLGTFQGLHYPAPNDPTLVEHRILAEHPDLLPQSEHEIPWFKAQQHEAMARVRQWYHTHPSDFFQSYLWIKPGLLWNLAYYPIRILGVLPETMKLVQHWLVWPSIIGHAVALVFANGKRRQMMMVALTLLYFTGLYSIFFVYGRYNEPIIWLMFLGIPAGIWTLVTLLLRAGGRRRKGVAVLHDVR